MGYMVSNAFHFYTWGRFPFWLIFFKCVETTTKRWKEFGTMELKKLQVMWGIYTLETPVESQDLYQICSSFFVDSQQKKKLRWKSRLPSCHLLNRPFFGPCQHSLALNELAASSGGFCHLNGECVWKGGDLYRICSMSLFGGSSKWW